MLVIGGSLAGIAAAARLAKLGHRVPLIEVASHLARIVEATLTVLSGSL